MGVLYDDKDMYSVCTLTLADWEGRRRLPMVSCPGVQYGDTRLVLQEMPCSEIEMADCADLDSITK